MDVTRQTAAVALVVACLAGPAVGHADSMYSMPGMYPGPGTYGMSRPQYVVNRYSGMYGSMGGVDSPYYQQLQPPALSGMPGMGGMQ